MLGPALGDRAVPARAARRGGVDRRAGRRRRGCCGALAQALLRIGRGGRGAGARDAGRAARRPLAEHRLLAARPRDLRRRARPPGRRCPAPGSGRAWTAVEREGNRVAAIVHDAELDATPELVHAAASAAALAIDNERLKADLRARLEELRHSRRAHRRGRRRRPPPDRARPARRRPAAARLARARPAAAARAAQARAGGGGHRRRSWPTSSPSRWPSCASSRAASTRPCSPTTASAPAIHVLVERAPLAGRVRPRRSRAGCRRRSRPPPTSWSPRGSRTSSSTPTRRRRR